VKGMVRWNEKYHDKNKAYTLYGKLLIPERYEHAWKKVKSNKGAAGIDKVTIEMFEKQLDQHIASMVRQLRNKRYQPAPVRRVEIPKPGSKKKRPLGIPTVRDRLVQQVLKEILEPIFEQSFLENSYGYRPERSAHDALKQAMKYAKKNYWVIDVDIQGFFDNVDHEILLDMVNEKVSDGSILKLIRKFLTAGVMKDNEYEPTLIGTPQGGVISPLLANIYLHHLDRRLEERRYRFVRYADDFLVFCSDKEEAGIELRYIEEVLKSELKLCINEEKTCISFIADIKDKSGKKRPERRDVEFLGHQMRRSRMMPSKKSIKRLKDKIRQETKRSWTRPTDEMIQRVNRIITGWANYFKHCKSKMIYKELDVWIRTRIRMNIGKCKVRHIKMNRRYLFIGWMKQTNSWFQERGLVSLTQYHWQISCPL
jgi:RNA-directed DNA polymerase